MTIVLWGLPTDPPLRAVSEALRAHGTPFALINQRDVLQTTMTLSVAAQVDGTIGLRHETIALGDVHSIYLRPYEVLRLPHLAALEATDPAVLYALQLEDTLACWVEITPARVINRPSDMASNNSKPFQLAQIKALGFNVPETLLTTDPAAALAFWEQHGSVIYKSISGVRSQVARLTEAHKPRLDELRWCPTQFQQYIAGTDYRVHVIGTDIFACRIVSGADDYRYPGVNQRPEVSSLRLSDDLADRCRALTRALHLQISGIDLRCTPAGDWYCFEVNPSPGFTYYEEETQQPISDAVARLLESA